MKKLSILCASALLMSINIVACGDDDDNPGAPSGGTKSDGGEDTSGGGKNSTGGKNNTGGKTGGGGKTSDGGTAPLAGETNNAGSTTVGGEGGGPNVEPCDIYGDRPVKAIPVDANGNITAT